MVVPLKNIYKDIYQLDIYQQVLIPQNNSNSCASFFDFYSYIENEEFPARLFGKKDSFGFDFIRMTFYCSNITTKMLHGRTGVELLRISSITSKIEHLPRKCKRLFCRTLKQNGQKSTIIFYLANMIQRHQEVFIKCNESLAEKKCKP